MLRASCFATILIAIAGPSAAQSHTITEFDPPNSIYTYPSGINSAGTIAGWYEDAQLSVHGFTRDAAGNFTSFDVPNAATGNGAGTSVAGINDSGQVVGWYNPSSAPQNFEGFVRDASGNITVVTVPHAVATQVFAINDAGEMTGCGAPTAFCYSDDSTQKGFVTELSGSLLTFAPPDAGVVNPAGINFSGVVAGSYSDTEGGIHGFVLAADGKITEFDAPGVFIEQSTGTEPTGINDAGVVVGHYWTPSFATRGFLRAVNGTFTEFDAPGSTFTIPTGVNSAGMSTGWYVISGNVGRWAAFVRDPLGNFASFNAPDADIQRGTYALSINATGQIAGLYYDKTTAHGFLRQ